MLPTLHEVRENSYCQHTVDISHRKGIGFNSLVKGSNMCVVLVLESSVTTNLFWKPLVSTWQFWIWRILNCTCGHGHHYKRIRWLLEDEVCISGWKIKRGPVSLDSKNEGEWEKQIKWNPRKGTQLPGKRNFFCLKYHVAKFSENAHYGVH